MTLREEILAGETAELEFKEARPKDALKYVKTAVAFANGRGGRLIFGVENETRRIVGVDPETVFREVDAIVDTISNDCEPAITLTTKIANVENRPLIVVEVAPGRHTPYYVRKLGMKDGTYVRVGARTRLAEPAVLKTLLIEGENKSFDLLPVKGRVVTKAEATRTARMMTKTARENCLDEEEAKRIKPMTIEQAEHGYSKIRNDGLALALSYMKEVEGWGGGVARYFTDWTAAGLPRPRLEETPGFFKVVFERKKTSDVSPNEPLNEPLNETVNEPVKMAVIEAVRKMPGVRRPALMRIVGKSRATLTRILSDLSAQGLIEHRGSDKTGGYFPVNAIPK